MKIIWFSEIKWSYLKTRKQQILSCFPDDDKVYFIEPISKRIENKYTLQEHKPVYSITIPQIRSVQSPLLNRILNFSVTRKIISFVSNSYFRLFRSIHKLKPDIVVISNVFWADSLRSMKKEDANLRMVYDCNDNPLAFPNTPVFKRDYFLKTVSIVDAITIPHSSYSDIIPVEHQNKIKIISNGVDYGMFQESSDIPDSLADIELPIIMYVGAISAWFDFDLIENIAQSKKDHQIVLIGPISNDVNPRMENLLKYENLIHIPPIPHEDIISYIDQSDVCIIPFVKNSLTETVLPNKLFEYAAAGKTCIMTNFNESLDEFKEYAHISDSQEDFIKKIEEGINNPFDPAILRQFAIQYDWKNISKKFKNLLESVTLYQSE